MTHSRSDLPLASAMEVKMRVALIHLVSPRSKKSPAQCFTAAPGYNSLSIIPNAARLTQLAADWKPQTGSGAFGA